MMSVFEKIREELEKCKELESYKCDENAKLNLGDFVAKYNHGEYCYLNAIKIVNQIEKEHNNGWIPCSERLPEEGQRCIVQYNGSPFINKEFYIDIDTFMDGEFGFYKGSGSIAWQPLPQPYKESDTDE